MSGISKSKISRLCAEIDEKVLNTILLNPAGFAEWLITEYLLIAARPLQSMAAQRRRLALHHYLGNLPKPRHHRLGRKLRCRHDRPLWQPYYREGILIHPGQITPPLIPLMDLSWSSS
jgi:hypothetical protein